MTPGDLITQALKGAGILGVGQTALAEDVNDAFTHLKMMLSQWQRKRWLVYHLVDVSKVSTGAQSYTVGAGQDFDIARPDRLEAAFVRQLMPVPVDFPLSLLESREDYNRIRLKTLKAPSRAIFYDAATPYGVVYPYPETPASIYELHLTFKALLQGFSTLADVITLPPEYEAAMLWGLMQRLRITYRLPADPRIDAMAADSLNLIRNANAQIPRLTMPRGLSRRGAYNIYSDGY